jgi:PAS domain S-box-containing protein
MGSGVPFAHPAPSGGLRGQGSWARMRSSKGAAYGLAVLVTGAALLAQLALSPYLRSTPFLLFFGAVMFSGWRGGWGPGLLSTALSAALANYFFLPPTYSFSLERVDLLSVAAFLLISTLITRLNVQARASWREGERQRQRLETVFAQAPAFIALVEGPEHVYTLSNTLNQEALGHRQVLGRPVREVLPEAAQSGMLAILDQVHTSGQPFIGKEVPVRVAQPDGSQREWFLNLVYQPVRDASGQVEGVAAFAVDVTEQVQAQEWLRLITDALPVLIAYVGRDCRYRLNNLTYEAWFGRPRSELAGLHLRDVLGETAYEAARPHIEAALSGRTVSYETQLPYRDAGPRHVHATYIPHRGATGTVEGFVVLVQDIHERKAAEAALAASEEQFRTLADSIPQLAWITQADGSIHWYNRRWYEYTGTTPGEMLAKGGWQRVVDPEWLAGIEARFRAAVASGSPWEDTFPLRRKDGELRWHLSRAMPVRDAQGRIVRWFGTNTDVEDQRRAEAALKLSEVRLRKLFDARLIGILYWSVDGGVMEANDAFLDMVGYSREDLEAGRLSWVELTPPEQRHLDQEALESMRMGGGHVTVEKDYIHKDGHRVPVLLGGVFFEGSRSEGVTFVLDISTRRRAEDHLRFLSEASRLLSESLDLEVALQRVAQLAASSFATYCLIDVVDQDGTLRRLAFAHRDEDQRRVLEESVRFTPRQGPDSPLLKALRSGRPVLLRDFGPELWKQSAQDPEHLHIIERLRPRSVMSVPMLKGERVAGVLTVATSGTQAPLNEDDLAMGEELARRASAAVENARLYREAREAIRLRDEFLSVASHELKTPLTSLKLQHELIARSLGPDSPKGMAARLAAAQRQVNRLASLVESLLDVTRIVTGRMTLELANVDLAVAAREAVERLSEVFAAAGCHVELQAERPVVGHWDALRLDQVLTNLLTNAAKYGAGKPVTVSVQGDGERARVEVRDEGIGIPPEDLPRIFGRFERAVSERHYGGLGLGLYISRHIIQELGGTVRAESTPGHGATFIVELPTSLAKSQV